MLLGVQVLQAWVHGLILQSSDCRVAKHAPAKCLIWHKAILHGPKAYRIIPIVLFLCCPSKPSTPSPPTEKKNLQCHLAMHHHWIEITNSFPSLLVDPRSSGYAVCICFCEGIPGNGFNVLYYKSIIPFYCHAVQVCSEETLDEILHRYLRYNSHAASYTWKHNGVNLDMSKTLSENGIPDEDDELDHCRMDRDLFTPSICLYFNDDLTEL